MAVLFRHIFHFPPPPPASVSPPCSKALLRRPFHCSASASSNMDSQNTKLMEFPYLSTSHKNLMVDLVSTVETRLASQLLPCTLPPDVQYYQNDTGTNHASLHIRSGLQSSPIDIILGSWVHCQLPTGGALNITNLFSFLNPSTDAPNFLLEIIQSSPTSLILVLDLPPRKDLVLHPDYLQTFYEDTHLDTPRKKLEKLAEVAEVKPYFCTALYVRSFVSPTAILLRIEAQEGGLSLEEIIENHIGPVAKEVMGMWLDQCACGGREVGENERVELKKRGDMMKKKAIETDLGPSSNFPRMFGNDVADRVVGAIRDAYRYATGVETSRQGDVYSYGILVLQMFTGRGPTDEMFKDGLNLHNFVKMAIPGRLHQILDPALLANVVETAPAATEIKVKNRNNGSDNEIEAVEEGMEYENLDNINIYVSKCILPVMKMGVACSEESPKNRISMEDFVRDLHHIQNAFIGLEAHRERPGRR